jgi:MFS family permease
MAGKIKLGPRYWRLWGASVISNLGDGVGVIAYPWLASAVTRNALLIALVAVVQRLPWLVFTLPAGVITDRVDRRKLIMSMDVLRAVFTGLLALGILSQQSSLPAPEDLVGEVAISTNGLVYGLLLAAALMMGFAEVLRDNAAQTILPALVETDQLEKANGNLWGAEMVMNSFVGPPIGSVLLAVGFAFPFFVDAGTFALAAGLVFLIPGEFKARRREGPAAPGKVSWKAEIKEGVQWLWGHPVLRPLAIVLGLLNGLGMVTFATFVYFVQENLDLETGLFTGVIGSLGDNLGFESTGAVVFAILMTSGALGGVIGGFAASRIAKAIGTGASLYVTMLTGIVVSAVIGVASRWWVVYLVAILFMISVMLWNVITVSLRQTIIPDELLGRVNSVYRFFGWGMMPLGSLVGGLIVTVGETFTSRSLALRLPYFVVAGAYVLLLAYAAPRLTTHKIEAARAEGIAAKAGDEAMSEAAIPGAPPPDD